MEALNSRITFEIASETYDQHVGRYSPRLAEALIAAAGVGRGDRVLDVGCGPGGLTQALAEVVGAERVAAVDPSERFVQAAQERVPGADIRLGAAEELPFPDGTFDAALSQLVVNFMRDAEAGVGEMRRVAGPGATVASCVWDYAGDMTMLRAFWDAALELDPDAPDEGRVMRYCRPDELRALWERVRLREVATGELIVRASYGSFHDFWAPFPSGLGPSGGYCASLPPERRAALREACLRRLGSPEGPFELSARAWFVCGLV